MIFFATVAWFFFTRGPDPVHEIQPLHQPPSALGSRQVPPQVNPVRPVGGIFAVDTIGERMALSSRNYSRYDPYVTLIEDIDTGALVTMYQRYYPLFQQAWEENGGEGPFNRRLQDVIDLLLETPDVPGPVYLVKPEGFYLFENPELEAMTAGEKTLVRMGSVNASIIKGKLAEIKAALNP